MTEKETLEILNMFTVAAQKAKINNVRKYDYDLKDATLKRLLKRAFPLLKNNNTLLNNIKNTII